MLASLADWVATSAGRLFVAASFAALLAMGIYGAIELTTDFKLEWFLPVDSYVRDFETLNQDYFTDGTRFSIYTTERTTYTDSTMSSIDAYLAGSSCVDGSSIDSWYTAFARSNSSLSATNVDTWLKQPQNKRFMGSVRFIDNDPGKGFMSTRIGAMMLLNCTESGTVRWNTLSDMRKGMEAIDSTVFPYSYLFAYWEEVGVIEKELFTNLGICGGVILVLIFAMIPKPLVAATVIALIAASVFELLGFMHWWGVTINGVSTIYILISVGLSVDYQVHIAHVFLVSKGTSAQRAKAALTRLGVSTFHAVFSTLAAVVVLAFAKAYVFQVFFKALCLIVLCGGFNGLVVLPTALALYAGDNDPGVVVSPDSSEDGSSEETTKVMQLEMAKA